MHSVEKVVVRVVVEGAIVLYRSRIQSRQCLDCFDVYLALVNCLFVAFDVRHEDTNVHLCDRALLDFALGNFEILLNTLLMRNTHYSHNSDYLVYEVVDVGFGVADLEDGDFALMAVACGAPLKRHNIWIVHIPSDSLK